MRGFAAVLLLLVAVSACERRADAPPAEPMEDQQESASPMPADQGGTPGAPVPAGGVVVQFMDGNGQPKGGARLEEEGEGVRISVRITGLQPNSVHGFHVHERGQCDPPDFQSAGGHFAPGGRQHGFENPAGPHAGDLPNIRANGQGVADTSFVAPGLRLTGDAAAALLREGGTALMVHAGPDDYRTDPAGDSGARIACGVIRGG
jgi:superoxide dismutase, Cu-Zn family